MKNYKDVLLKAMDWINSPMLTFDHGYYGIYERIRIDEHIRTNWCRPDCNAEYMRVLVNYGEMTGDDTYVPLQENIFDWLSRIQDKRELSIWRGSFPFYVIEGHIREPEVGESLYQNDNGKIIVCLCRIYQKRMESRYLIMAEEAAAYWIRVQQSDGTFGLLDGKNMETCRKGPCFVQWLVSGLFLLYQITGIAVYRAAAEGGIHYLLGLLQPSGRCATSYEVIHMEDWRPVSSETSIMLYTLCIAYQTTGEERLLGLIEKTGGYLLSLQKAGSVSDGGGAVRNCDNSSSEASLQNNKDLCDLVYTAGFALQAFVLAYEVTKEMKYKTGAVRLADFLAQIQCSGESSLWDGGWRGSYNIKTGEWDGRSNQNNPIDEGGMYSVYTGWCCTNICIGLQELMRVLEEEEGGCISYRNHSTFKNATENFL